MNSNMQKHSKLINEYLSNVLVDLDSPSELISSMNYSLLAGGKRIRPALLLEFYRILGKEPAEVLNFAAAIEMIHTYSLIHDDLPCMDNDDMRRGKPSNHIQFGEATALLAGDALLTQAFFEASKSNLDSERVVKAINLLANAAGMCNMVGGQVLDLAAENKNITIDELIKLQNGKTVAMIKVPALIACVLAGATNEQTIAASHYCECIGRAFQIRDDILDVIGDEDVFGKPIGSDSENEKNTFVSKLGLEKSEQLVCELTNEAIDALSVFNDAKELCELAKKLAVRIK